MLKQRFLTILTLLICSLAVMLPNKADAQVPLCCVGACAASSAASLTSTMLIITNFLNIELTQHEQWLSETAIGEKILPAMKLLADQLTAAAMHQTLAVGMFFDAKHQMETQRLLQVLQAQAHKDYHPSTGMCTFGSSVQSLAASERKSEVNALFLSQRSLDRQLGNTNTAAQFGAGFDADQRLEQFKGTYCDPNNNNGGLASLCGDDGAADPVRSNKDIDFARTIDQPWSLDVDFTDANLKEDEEDVLALASNLYGHQVMRQFDANDLAFDAETNRFGANDARKDFMDTRALIAKRSVAESSFNNIAAMKSAGSGGSTEFLEAIVKELGITGSADLKTLLGENPSYHAQMEVLTKKIYQNPDFYTNLYDKPANVRRKAVAMQAIGLMQKFDMLDSALRQEASLSVLLELAVSDLQTSVENQK